MHREAQEVLVGFLSDGIHLVCLWNSFDQNHCPGAKTQSFLYSSFTVRTKKKEASVWEVWYFPVRKVRSQCMCVCVCVWGGRGDMLALKVGTHTDLLIFPFHVSAP
jgi:hypothetical protein